MISVNLGPVHTMNAEQCQAVAVDIHKSSSRLTWTRRPLQGCYHSHSPIITYVNENVNNTGDVP